MENNSNLPNNLSIQEVMRLAGSPAGQQLIAMLQAQGGAAFQNAMSSAAAGDYTQAKQVIAAMLSDPKAQQLLKDLGR